MDYEGRRGTKTTVVDPHRREDEYKTFQEAVERHFWKYEYIAFNLFSKQVAVIIS